MVSETTTAEPSLSAAQEIYCEDLLTVVAVATATGGSTNRPETVTFLSLAERLGYLRLPYRGEGWPYGIETIEEFIFLTILESDHLLDPDVGDALIEEWRRNLEGAGADFESAFVETCLEAWQLR